MFHPVHHDTYGFSHCGDCTDCCDGSRFLFLPLVLDDFVEVADYFPILFALIDGEWRALLLLSDGRGTCPYLECGLCKIYNYRPPGCRIYPLSPLGDQIMIDQDCPAVIKGDNLLKSGKIEGEFFHSRWENFPQKLLQTRAFLKRISSDLRFLMEVKNIRLHLWREAQDDVYGRTHLKSLKNLSNYSLSFEKESLNLK